MLCASPPSNFARRISLRGPGSMNKSIRVCFWRSFATAEDVVNPTARISQIRKIPPILPSNKSGEITSRTANTPISSVMSNIKIRRKKANPWGEMASQRRKPMFSKLSATETRSVTLKKFWINSLDLTRLVACNSFQSNGESVSLKTVSPRRNWPGRGGGSRSPSFSRFFCRSMAIRSQRWPME